MPLRRPTRFVATCAAALAGAVALSACMSTADWQDGDSLLPDGGGNYGASEAAPGGGLLGVSRLMPRGLIPGRAGEPEQPQTTFADIGYADWTDAEPPYRFYPGDEVEISVPSAPELNRTSVVQPDGRISLNLVGPVMAADRTTPQLQDALTQAYANILLRPSVNIAVKSVQPIKVFVGGEVNNPGAFDMVGDGDALRAVMQAGGFRTSAKTGQVVVIRRAPDGRPMMRSVNLGRGLKAGAGAVDLVPLRRFDIVFVPRSSVAEASLFVQQYFRDLSPIQFGLNYDPFQNR